MKNLNIKEITLIGTLTAIGIIVSIVDKLISSVAFPFLPMAKIGLANVVVLYGIYKLGYKKALVMAILKSTITGLIFGSLMSFVIGFTGTMLSFIMMVTFHKLLKEKLSVIGISVIGGMFHITGQILVIKLIYNLHSEVLLYLGWLMLVSVITSIIVGMITNKIIEIKGIK